MKSKVDRQQIKLSAKSKVAEVLSQEDLAAQKAKIEELFVEMETDMAELKVAKEAATEGNDKLSQVVEDLKSEKKELEATVKTLNDEKDTLQKQLDESAKKLADIESKVTDMEKEAASQKRIKELEEAGVFSGEKQISRVKNMDDEEFASYKEELLELRRSWEAKTAPKDKPSEDNKTEGGDEGKKAKASVDNPEDDDDEVKLTKKTLAEIMELRKTMASMNLPTNDAPDAEQVKEYANIWEEEEGK